MNLIFLLLLEASAPRAAPSSLSCPSANLRSRDCHLQLGSLEIDLLDQTIAWTDGTWHRVDPMPLVGEGVEWEKIKLENAAGTTLLQAWIWDKASGETKIQSLHWYVLQFANHDVKTLWQGVVDKRHPETPGDDNPGKTKTVYLKDKTEVHGFRVVKTGRIEWWLGGERHQVTLD